MFWLPLLTGMAVRRADTGFPYAAPFAAAFTVFRVLKVATASREDVDVEAGSGASDLTLPSEFVAISALDAVAVLAVTDLRAAET
jgi:hypothetical protein